MTPSKRFLIISLLIIFLFSVLIKPALAARELEVQIPGLKTTTLPALPDYIKAIFEFSLMAVGIICFGALIYGGLRWLTSAGNPAALSDAKDQIFSALIGLIILFSAYLIFRTINPELVILNPIPGGGCHSNAECPAGFRCTGGFCRGDCHFTDECPAGYKCSGGICIAFQPLTACERPIDPPDPPCPAGQQCIANYCTLPPAGSWGTETCSSFTIPGDCTNAGCAWCPICSGSYVNKWAKDICLKPEVICEYQTTVCSEYCSLGGGCQVCERWDQATCSCVPAQCCLKEGSLILTPDGFKTIEDLKEGDYVIGYRNGEKVNSKVLAKSEHTGEFNLYFYKEYWFTENHLIYLDNYKDFKPVTELSSLTKYFNGKVYNIQTETKNYFGENNLLIHNK